jgi:hypothetical protein
MTGTTIKWFFRMNPASLVEQDVTEAGSVVAGPSEFLAALKPGVGIVVAAWDPVRQLGCASRLGIVLGLDATGAKVRWATTDALYRPNPLGRRYWTQEKPFFVFDEKVAERYMLAAAFAEQFPDEVVFDRARKPTEVQPSANPTGGYVYLVRSQHGIKIGKSMNVKSRTRLFGVMLPFPITIEHYAWFDDYTRAERELHVKYDAQRLEGEWFNLSADDVAHIKTLGKPVPPESL